MKPSELFLKVLFAPPTNIVCDRIEKACYLNYDGIVCGCCLGWVLPFGNLKDDSLTTLYNGVWARIIKLSSLNRSYCLCNLKACMDACYADTIDTTLKSLQIKQHPEELTLAIDRSCNLNCPSCRRCAYVPKVAETQFMQNITAEILASGWLEQVTNLVIAGMGEVFYSPYYRQLLLTDLKRQEVRILSNGILFDEKNFQMIKDKYTTIHAYISIDAATPETYQKVRGGGVKLFEKLLKNLAYIGQLRQQNKISFFKINFIVQKDNFHEMKAFVELGKRYHVDEILFTHLNNWGTFSRKQYLAKSLIIKGKYFTKELYQILQDPIFQEPGIDLSGLTYYLQNSRQKYEKQRK